MSFGDVIQFRSGSYEVRGHVDGRIVVRIRDRVRNTEKYTVMTEQEFAAFAASQAKMMLSREHSIQIFRRKENGEKGADLAKEFGLTPARVSKIYARIASDVRRGKIKL